MKNKLISDFNLPKDVFLGDMIITLIGRDMIMIENYKGIIGYTETEVTVQGKNEKIVVYGDKLFIKYFMSDNMKIEGIIKGVKYL